MDYLCKNMKRGLLGNSPGNSFAANKQIRGFPVFIRGRDCKLKAFFSLIPVCLYGIRFPSETRFHLLVISLGLGRMQCLIFPENSNLFCKIAKKTEMGRISNEFYRVKESKLQMAECSVAFSRKRNENKVYHARVIETWLLLAC